MKVFISYHRVDTEYREKAENILKSHEIDYYVVPEDANFDGKRNETIRNFLCNRLKKCDVLLCLIGEETYSRPHVDREIHTALKGNVGERLGVIGVKLPTRKDCLYSPKLTTFPAKLWDNKKYVVWSNWEDLNDNINDLVKEAYRRSIDDSLETNHKNPCMPLRAKIYYDN